MDETFIPGEMPKYHGNSSVIRLVGIYSHVLINTSPVDSKAECKVGRNEGGMPSASLAASKRFLSTFENNLTYPMIYNDHNVIKHTSLMLSVTRETFNLNGDVFVS